MPAPDDMGLYNLKGWLKVPILYNQPGLELIGQPLGFSAIRVSALTTCEPGHNAALTHCGGPGSTLSCLLFKWYRMFDLLSMSWDNLAITQRGIDATKVDPNPPKVPFVQADGMTPVEPFPVINCYEAGSFHALAEVSKMFDAANLDFKPYFDAFVEAYERPNFDVEVNVNPTLVKLQSMLTGAAQQLCRKDYDLGTNPVRGQMSYQDFAGTQDLAHDMDTFRRAIGQQKLSVWGVSYGTEVGATYATIFPENVHRLVLDGNVAISNKIYDAAKLWALSYEQVWQGLANACNSDYWNGADSESSCAATPYPTLKIYKVIGDSHERRVSALNLLAEAFDEEGIMQSGVDPYGAIVMACVQSAATGQGFDGPGCAYKDAPPKSEKEPLPPNLLEVVDQLLDKDEKSNQAVLLVRAVDMSGRLTMEDLANLWMRLQEEHPLGFLRASNIISIASAPNIPRPVPPYGSSSISPLIIGELYDPATTYTAAQTMSSFFPQGALMTWQGYHHGLPQTAAYSPDVQFANHIEGGAGFGAYDCVQKMSDYFELGTLPDDGYTCPTNGPGASTLSLANAKAAVARGVVIGGSESDK